MALLGRAAAAWQPSNDETSLSNRFSPMPRGRLRSTYRNPRTEEWLGEMGAYINTRPSVLFELSMYWYMYIGVGGAYFVLYRLLLQKGDHLFIKERELALPLVIRYAPGGGRKEGGGGVGRRGGRGGGGEDERWKHHNRPSPPPPPPPPPFPPLPRPYTHTHTHTGHLSQGSSLQVS